MEAARKGGKAAQEGEAKERRTGHHPEECPVCMTVFDDTVQRPRTLPCGHTVCTQCVNTLKQQGHVACPECRVSHALPKGGHFPVSYTVEALIRRMRDAEVAATPLAPLIDWMQFPEEHAAGTWRGAAAATGQKEAAGLSRKMRSFLEQQEVSVVAAITAWQEVQAQLDQCQTTLTGWGEQQQLLEDRLHGLLDQSKSARELVRQESSRVAAKKEEAREREQQLHAALEALRTPGTDKEAGVVIAEVFRCTFEAKEVLEEYRESFPDTNTATIVRKVKKASNAALKAFQANLEAHSSVPGEEPLPQSEVDCTLIDILNAIVTPSLKAEDLRNPTQPIRLLLEAGRMFGVHQVEGHCRYARISLEAGRVYLHTLKKGPLPPSVKVIQVSQVVPPSPPCVVFLDLSWPGSAPRRVHIRLSPDTPLGRQAVLLCTGQRGPSYAGTCFFIIGDKGQPGERVLGGDYEYNDGRGGAALLPDHDEGDYRESREAGAVLGWLVDPSHGTLFAIRTRDKPDGFVNKNTFGEVVQGLDAVVAAAQHTNIKEVTIKDCGVVLLG